MDQNNWSIRFTPDGGIERVEQVHPDRVTFTSGRNTRKLVVDQIDGQPWSQPVLPAGPLGPKYRLEPDRDSGLQRLVALRPFGEVVQGERGGLVPDGNVLSHDGVCWIHAGATVFDRSHSSIHDDAELRSGSQIRGDLHMHGNAVARRVTVSAGGYLQVSGESEVTGTTVHGAAVVQRGSTLTGCTVGQPRLGRGATIEVQGSSLERVTLVAGEDSLVVRGAQVMGAQLRYNGDLLTLQTRFGPLHAFRAADHAGVLRYHLQVGCQRKRTFEDLRESAALHGCSEVELAQLESFFDMVRVAAPGWGVVELPPTREQELEGHDLTNSSDDDDDDDDD